MSAFYFWMTTHLQRARWELYDNFVFSCDDEVWANEGWDNE